MITILNSSTGVGVRHSPLTDAFVPEDAFIASTDDLAIYAAGPGGAFQGLSMMVKGTVMGEYGIQMGTGFDEMRSNRLHIDESGSVSAFSGNAISMYGSYSELMNEGDVQSYSYAVYLYGDGGDPSSFMSLINRGSILSIDSIAVVAVSDALSLRNSGEIVGDFYAIYTGSARDEITNSGRIEGWIFSGAGGDTIVNSGTIQGNVSMYEGNDLFDNRGGEVIGRIFGGPGNDTFILSKSAEAIFGNLGSDTIRFDGLNRAVVYLDGREGGGAAIGDSYQGIENVVGSALGADQITGNAEDNLLDGRDGDDRLFALTGRDRLVGGEGKDTLAGGNGNDRFIYYDRREGGDRIVDFGSNSGNNDGIRIDASGFGLSLPAGELSGSRFASGSSNAAQDADDRFILRTTDKTLWFDPDGKGGSRPTMIADLQDSATLNQSDIFIF